MTHLLVRYHSIKATSYFLPGIFSSSYSCADRDKNSAWRAKRQGSFEMNVDIPTLHC